MRRTPINCYVFVLACAMATPSAVYAEMLHLDLPMYSVASEVEQDIWNIGLAEASKDTHGRPKQRRIMRLCAQLAGKAVLAKKLGRESFSFPEQKGYFSPILNKAGEPMASMHLVSEKGPHDYTISFTTRYKEPAEVVVVWREKTSLEKIHIKVVPLQEGANKGTFFGSCEDFHSYVMGAFDEDGQLLDILPRKGVITPASSGRYNPADTWRCADSYVLHDQDRSPPPKDAKAISRAKLSRRRHDGRQKIF